jgi:hypothetical protein
MARWQAGTVFFCLLVSVRNIAWAQDELPDHTAFEQGVEELSPPSLDDAAETQTWIDRTHSGVHALVWRSARKIDGMFGSDADEAVYQGETRGSIVPAVLWDEFGGFSEKFRFRVKVPLPQIGERFDAFIGTFNRDEYVTGRTQESGAIPQQHAGGQVDEDETLVGIRYREPKEGGRWESDAGLRIRSPVDPFVKGGYRYARGDPEHVRLTLRETVFWQNSEQFGFTSRVDLERTVAESWTVRWIGSGTISERSEGVRGYTSLTAYRGIGDRRAIGGQIFTAGEFDAAVPLGEYGLKVAYRQTFLRDWLVFEIRPSVTWPKTDPSQPRKPSWGLGIGFEMFLGPDKFEPRPATF